MGKIRVEVCLISARGLRRSSSLWKLQWYAVGWIEPNNKYCTKIDASSNPVWKTKFSTMVEPNSTDLTLQVEVYCRDPIFLREKLHGIATVFLKEFLENHFKGAKQETEEVGSFQLRRKHSNKPQGFVDVSVRISEEREERSEYSGEKEGIQLMDHRLGILLPSQDTPPQAYPPQPQPQPQPNSPYSHPIPFPTNYSNPSPNYPLANPTNYSNAPPNYPLANGTGSYQLPRTPPPPPPPSNVGFIPTFIPRTDHLNGTTNLNMPSSSSSTGAPMRNGVPAGFGMGLGAGAMAAGAVIFGDDFMSGFDLPSGLQGDHGLTISTNPPF